MTSVYLFWILFYLWLALEILFAARARSLQSGQAKKQTNDRGSALIIMVGMYLLLFVSFFFSAHQLGKLPIWTIYVGYILMVIGMGIRFSAILQLGRFFSPIVGVVSDQEIVQTGLYRWIRHPAYTGGWMTAVGIGISLRTWWGALLCAIGLWLIYAYRIRVEEQVMTQHFGESYVKYSKSTRKMFPGIW